MNPSSQPRQGTTLRQKVETVQSWCMILSLPVIVFIRRDVGYRLLKPGWLVLLAFAIYITPAIFVESSQPYPFVLPLYAAFLLMQGLLQRFLRWRELRRGMHSHSFSAGVSYLERLPWPRFMREERRIYRFVDPIFCGGFVYMLSFYSQALC